MKVRLWLLWQYIWRRGEGLRCDDVRRRCGYDIIANFIVGLGDGLRVVVVHVVFIFIAAILQDSDFVFPTAFHPQSFDSSDTFCDFNVARFSTFNFFGVVYRIFNIPFYQLSPDLIKFLCE